MKELAPYTRAVAAHTSGSSSASQRILGPADWLDSREPQRARISAAPSSAVSRSTCALARESMP